MDLTHRMNKCARTLSISNTNSSQIKIILTWMISDRRHLAVLDMSRKWIQEGILGSVDIRVQYSQVPCSDHHQGIKNHLKILGWIYTRQVWDLLAQTSSIHLLLAWPLITMEHKKHLSMVFITSLASTKTMKLTDKHLKVILAQMTVLILLDTYLAPWKEWHLLNNLRRTKMISLSSNIRRRAKQLLTMV